MRGWIKDRMHIAPSMKWRAKRRQQPDGIVMAVIVALSCYWCLSLVFAGIQAACEDIAHVVLDTQHMLTLATDRRVRTGCRMVGCYITCWILISFIVSVRLVRDVHSKFG